MNIAVNIETNGEGAENILNTIIENFISYAEVYKLNLNITELHKSAQPADSTADPTVRPFGAAD